MNDDERRAFLMSSNAKDCANQAWIDLTMVSTSPLTTNDPFIACALLSIAAELRAIRVASDAPLKYFRERR